MISTDILREGSTCPGHWDHLPGVIFTFSSIITVALMQRRLYRLQPSQTSDISDNLPDKIIAQLVLVFRVVENV